MYGTAVQTEYRIIADVETDAKITIDDLKKTSFFGSTYKTISNQYGKRNRKYAFSLKACNGSMVNRCNLVIQQMHRQLKRWISATAGQV